MGEVFQTLDIVIFFAALIGVMGVGLFAGRKDEETSEDYFLASRKIPWWGVAGSIYGSNVSANHMVGMMGVGFTIGFAQSHFELGAILGLMVLCYFFLPVYRKLRVFTLSEYLEKRYDHRSRLVYSIIMTVIMAVIHLVPGLYIGSRTICTLLGGEAAVETAEESIAAVTVAEVKAAEESDPGAGVSSQPVRKVVVNWNHYAFFVIALALVAAGYTIVGGLTAVVWTDFIQSMLLLGAGLLIAVLRMAQQCSLASGTVGGRCSITTKPSMPAAVEAACTFTFHRTIPACRGPESSPVCWPCTATIGERTSSSFNEHSEHAATLKQDSESWLRDSSNC